MNADKINEICSTLGIKTETKDKKKHQQYIRVLVTADPNDGDYQRKETDIPFADSELPIILAGLKAFSKIGSFENLNNMSEDDKLALWNWSYLGLSDDDKISIEEYSFENDENLTDMIPFSDEGCGCGGDRINGCHSLSEITVVIVDENKKTISLEF